MLFSLFVWKEDTGFVAGKASHVLDPDNYTIKKKAVWKQKPPLVTVSILPINENKTIEASETIKEKNEESDRKSKRKAKEPEDQLKEPKDKETKDKHLKDKEPKDRQSKGKEPETSPNLMAALPAGAEQVHVHAGNMVTQGMQQLDAGMFTEAHASFLQSVATLVNFSSQAYQVFNAEMQFAIHYAQATLFLTELKRLNSLQLYKQMALLSSFLAEIPLQTSHSVINVRIAIELNFQVGNFGIVAHLIQSIAALAASANASLPEQGLLEEMLEHCNSKGCSDNCVPLGGPANRVICLATFRLVQGTSYTMCPYCKATYRPHLQSVCSFCNTILQEHTVVQ
eukprot:TRINITY_DN2801_c0_g1_i1.p1 TRINITY_DN2801_c0_g1~~TRINITY_DN2801_c0_g1_i1.p1  ORF type:complete len:340 (+),score=72.47 TRINITY_DN2801_c0_g1_i1:355-1374(+)